VALHSKKENSRRVVWRWFDGLKYLEKIESGD